MTFILKIVESEGSPVASDQEHSLFADIVSVSFRRDLSEGGATAHVWLREPVKTAEVPGFVEVEKHITFVGSAYVMNEAGKTISTFTARRSAAAMGPPRYSGLDDEQLRALPYAMAANYRREAKQRGDRLFIAQLDRLQVAVDA